MALKCPIQEQNQVVMTCSSSLPERRVNPHPNQVLRCPRCDSFNTKFCYYNNYSLTQPRHFCKNCRRYWTKDGVLRNVPVGGGCRSNKRSKQRNAGQTTHPSAEKSSHAVSGTSISGENSPGTSAPTFSNKDPGSPNNPSPENMMGSSVPSGFLDLLVYGEQPMSDLPPFDVLSIPSPQRLTGISNNNNNKTTTTSRITGESTNLPRAIFLSSRSNTPILNGLYTPFDTSALLGIALPNARGLRKLDHQGYGTRGMPHSIPTGIEILNSHTDSTVISTMGTESRNATNLDSLQQWRSQQCQHQLPYQQDYQKWIGDLIPRGDNGRSTHDQQHMSLRSMMGGGDSSSNGHARVNGNNGPPFEWQRASQGGQFEEGTDQLCHVNGQVFPELSGNCWRDTCSR